MTRADGLLTMPLVHDKTLGGVSYKTSTLTLEIEDVDQKTVFKLDGVQEANLRIWSKSLVSEVIIWRIGDLREAGKSAADEVWPTLFDGQLFDHDIEKLAHQITARNPNSLLFVLTCSYGGTMACIAETIAVYQDYNT
jgi:hypothetical protein